jgi:serine protease Do
MNKWLAWLSLSFGLAVAAHAADLPDFTGLVQQESPSVVNITTTTTETPGRHSGEMPAPDDMFKFFRKFMIPGEPGLHHPFSPLRRGEGSGFIISSDGYILTDAHVVDDADQVTVKLNDKREFRAKVVGVDKRTDVALIKIKADNLPKVTIGDPNKLKVGAWVLAIGAPFGFANSVTAGIVSAKDRILPDDNYVPFIQTDAAVNPGNSGGPLFNMDGQVVGVNSQIVSRSGGYMGLSFAIPIDVAMNVADQLKAHGRVSRGRLGVLIQEVTADLADSFGLPKPEGALVSQVEPGSPADKAGLQPSDIILKFDGKDIDSSIDLPRLVGATRPGTRATLTVWRKGALKDLNVVVGTMPDEQMAKADNGMTKVNRVGLVVSDLTPAQKNELDIMSGVLVEDVSGAAAVAGIHPGDVIMAVNNQNVDNTEDLTRLLQDTKNKSVALLVKRGKGALFLPLRLD